MGFLEITRRRLEGGTGHEHIVEFECRNRDGNLVFATQRAMVEWLRVETNAAVVYVPSRRTRAIVGIMRAPDGQEHVRTHSQTGWESHLLALPDLEANHPHDGLLLLPRSLRVSVPH